MRMVTLVNPALGKLERLLCASAELQAVPVRTATELGKQLAQAEALVVSNMMYDSAVAATLRQARHLRWIQTTSIGFDRLTADPPPAHIVVTNAAGIKSGAVAEHAMALLLSLSRQIHGAVRAQVEARWDTAGLAPGIRSLAGRHLLCLGYGGVGRAVAVRAKAFSMHVTAMNRGGDGGAPADTVVPVGRLNEILPSVDALVLCAPLTPATRDIIGAAELALMKPEAMLINVGRGQLVDQDALADALMNRTLAGAGLDVFAEEPLPVSSPLWRAANVILTPHVAGHGGDSDADIVSLVEENARRLRGGLPMLNTVSVS